MPLDNLVKSNRGKGRGSRGSGRIQKANPGLQQRAAFGRGMRRGQQVGGRGGGAVGITARLGFTTKQNGLQTKNVQKVSDLRDVLATKTKSSVADLRTKLPPKSSSKQEKKKNSPAHLQGRSSFRISSDMFRSSRPKEGAGSSRSKDAIFSKGHKEGDRILSRRLPTTAEAKKITVTVQGLSKTTSEVRRDAKRK